MVVYIMELLLATMYSVLLVKYRQFKYVGKCVIYSVWMALEYDGWGWVHRISSCRDLTVLSLFGEVPTQLNYPEATMYSVLFQSMNQ